MKKTIIAVSVFSLVLTGCGGNVDDGAVEKNVAPAVASNVELLGVDYPVYGASKIYTNFGTSIAYTVDSTEQKVMDFYDKKLVADGWRFAQDWTKFGETSQKDFQRGEVINAQFGTENVKLTVGAAKGGGTFYSISPIPTKFKK